MSAGPVPRTHLTVTFSYPAGTGRATGSHSTGPDATVVFFFMQPASPQGPISAVATSARVTTGR